MINKINNSAALIQNSTKPTPSEENSKENFKDTLDDLLKSVNELQIEDSETTEAFLKGEVTDLHQVTIAAQKARVSLELLMEIRNKLTESYQEIMRMQV